MAVTETNTAENVTLRAEGQTIILQKTSDGSLDIHVVVQASDQTWEDIVAEVKANHTVTTIPA